MVQFNSKGYSGSLIHQLRNKNAGKLCFKIENERKRRCARNAAKRLLKPRRKIFKDTVKSNRFYGPDCQRTDMPERLFELAKQAELAERDADKVNSGKILTETYGQRHNTRWFEVRRKLVHSHYFHRIVNAISPKSFKNIVDEMLYSPPDLGKTAAST